MRWRGRPGPDHGALWVLEGAWALFKPQRMPLKRFKQRDDMIRCGVFGCLSGCRVGGWVRGRQHESRNDQLECHVIVPGRGHVGLKEGGGYKGGEKERR